MERTLLVVTGLAREARVAEGAGVTTLCSGGDSLRLADMLRSQDSRGWSRLWSLAVLLTFLNREGSR